MHTHFVAFYKQNPFRTAFYMQKSVNVSLVSSTTLQPHPHYSCYDYYIGPCEHHPSDGPFRLTRVTAYKTTNKKMATTGFKQKEKKTNLEYMRHAMGERCFECAFYAVIITGAVLGGEHDAKVRPAFTYM